MNQGFWMAKNTGCLADGELTYDNSSRVESKRSHQWFMDGPEAELFPNKKQAVDLPTNNIFSGISNTNISPWGNAPSFHPMSGPFTERLFDSGTSRPINFDERNLHSASANKMNVGRKVNEDPFDSHASFGLSMSHNFEEPRSSINYGGLRKVKVSEVKDSETVIPVTSGQAYNRGDNSNMPTLHAYTRADDNIISMGLTYSKGGENIISVGDGFVREDNSFISMGQPYYRGDENISVSQTFKENDNSPALAHTFNKGDTNVTSMGQTYKGDDNTISMGDIYNKGAESTVSLNHTCSMDDNNNLSTGNHYSKRDSSTIISFGGYDDDDGNPSGRLICNYDLLMGQPSSQKSDVVNEKESIQNADTLPSNIQTNASGVENVSKKKEEVKASKKVPLNNFPSNVRSLLSTNIFDGVPVKYVAWSREKELCGFIRGSGYLCGCQSCNLSKVVNAYEFERHAGCKTKHPNNHIYFESGKTIYGIVQELRSTPQDMLFDVIQTITGSQINQKYFRLWKESFLAATRELQRIYGKDEGKKA